MSDLVKVKNLIHHIEVVCDALYQNNLGDGLGQVPRIVAQLADVLEEVVAKEEASVELEPLQASLDRLFLGLDEKDHVYVADVLTFEITKSLEEIFGKDYID